MTLPFSAITLIGHSGIGKTTLSNMLGKSGWYHYSGDYRIATRYLNEAINDWLTALAAQVPDLQSLIARDVVRVQGKVGIEQLAVLSAYISKVGKQGLPFAEFCARQRAFAEAEKRAMYDIERFMQIANKRLGLPYFINDAGGSLGEYIDDTALMQFLFSRTLLVYLHAEEDLQSELEARAARYPKPICYDPDFLAKMVSEYGQQIGEKNPDWFDSNDFLAYVGPKMLRHRRARYMALAERYGVLLPVRKVWACQDGTAFLSLLEQAYQEQRG